MGQSNLKYIGESISSFPPLPLPACTLVTATTSLDGQAICPCGTTGSGGSAGAERYSRPTMADYDRGGFSKCRPTFQAARSGRGRGVWNKEMSNPALPFFFPKEF